MAKNILWSPKNHNNLLYKFTEYLYKKKPTMRYISSMEIIYLIINYIYIEL